jgi:cell division septation protein DedD
MPKKNAGEIVELGVSDDDFAAPETETTAAAAPVTDSAAPTTTAVTPVIEEEAPPAATTAAPQQPPTTTIAVAAPPVVEQIARPHIAQLLSTGDQKTAEALAVRVINRGFNTAYVERGTTDKGPVYRVRIRFDSEAEARAAEPKLREFSKEVWITAK